MSVQRTAEFRLLQHIHKEWNRNNFPIGITIEYATTGKADGHIMVGAPESVHQPAQQLGNYYALSS